MVSMAVPLGVPLVSLVLEARQVWRWARMKPAKPHALVCEPGSLRPLQGAMPARGTREGPASVALVLRVVFYGSGSVD